jgi:uncharacterized protein DUF6152
MRRAWVALAVTGALAGALPAHAHHSFSAIYDESRDVAVDGTIREFRFVHPHPVLVIDAIDAQGVKHSWQAEMDNRYELEEIGITARTFRPGDHVEAHGSPGRKRPDAMYLWKLVRPSDGLRYEQIGTTPYLHTR